MSNKTVIYGLLIIIIISAVWYFSGKNKSVSQVEPIQNNQQDVIDEPQVSKEPQFIFGSVIKVDSKKIILKVDSSEKTIILDEKTEIVKRIKLNGEENIAPAVFADIKTSSNIIVSYTETSKAGYKANNIQILDF
jgi:hypothetical protein